ncbi:protein arginine kinase [candidate division WOR-3 bacterium]|uniref:Protein arginine kinase n=1 Tax=candidate division WOR-3 bacterium TaxID=2052148 RepID=A0A9D5K9A5_UNCW3|nr:protein arginine kinase [candidate division WOR-3 bacterium]MBD3364494.1 protein arginine kinase [candidate division WOR-3 bacterium]
MTLGSLKSGLDSRAVGSWLSGEGPQGDIVISSRIRLARNISGIRFLSKTSQTEQKDIIKSVDNSLSQALISHGRKLVEVEDLSSFETQFLLERHLLSPDFLKSKAKRGFFSTVDESFSLMVNEEDHLRLQMLGSGLCLDNLWDSMKRLDERINSVIPFAFEDNYGFLTACPTNVGTGMRASILIHLPGVVLTKEIDRVLRGVLQLGLSVRGTYGEGTETKGHLFQISNQRTLGQSEEEIISTLTKMASQLITYENEAREYILTKMKNFIEDKLYRSLGILRYARMLTSDEVINLLSTLRFGIGILPNLTAGKLNKLMILTRPANLQFFFGAEFSTEQRDRKRAELIKRALKNVEA